ncbi:MAG TPA: hypothetical protein VIL86_17580 [Tepidisphaeraceae bacterium]|jgi:hypothetical protein
MSTSTPSVQPLIVKLTAIGPGPAAEIRFRKALKALRRSYRLRAHWLSGVEQRQAEAVEARFDAPGTSDTPKKQNAGESLPRALAAK